MRHLFLLLFLSAFCFKSYAGPGDSIIVQAFTFGSNQDSTFKFPSDTLQYQKILMYYTLKCNPKNNPACGQWDYLTYTYLYQPTGTYDSSISQIDTFRNPDSTIKKIDTVWSVYEVNTRFELGRYITPYGIGLSLGNGFTWVYDVTDYGPLLHDSVHLSAGNWQELLDLKFVFIQGTPPRKPYKVVNLWNGNFNYGLTPPIDSAVKPKNVLIDANAVNTRLKVRVTGHGEDDSDCMEFCGKMNYFSVNGVQRWSQFIWRNNCAYNPVPAQGGTWIYQRANWCPGSEVWTYDAELTPYVTAGQNALLHYYFPPYTYGTSSSGNSIPYYALETQLVYYNKPNFTQDVAMERIVSPTMDDYYNQVNPICGSPVVIIKNTGTTTLTSCTISYGMIGQTPVSYNWTGSLTFMDTVRVVLPTPDYGNFAAGNYFICTVSNPNGGQDQYAYNNTMTSQMAVPAEMPGDFVVYLVTNNAAAENAWQITDPSGKVWYSGSNFKNASIYKDTIHLPNGCYQFLLTDAGQDGLSFFANNDGNGSIGLFSASKHIVLKSFNPDFGAQILFNFTTNFPLSINQVYTPKHIDIYPNPGNGNIYLDLTYLAGEDVNIQVYTTTGQKVLEKQIGAESNIKADLDFQNQPAGVYIINVTSGDKVYTEKYVLVK